MVGRSISGTQKDVDTKSDSDRCVAMAADGLQLSTFRVSKDEPGRRWERHTISMRPPITLVKTFQIQETSAEAAWHVLLHVEESEHQSEVARVGCGAEYPRDFDGHLHLGLAHDGWRQRERQLEGVFAGSDGGRRERGAVDSHRHLQRARA